MLGFFKLELNNIYFYCFGQYSPCFRIQCSGERCTDCPLDGLYEPLKMIMEC